MSHRSKRWCRRAGGGGDTIGEAETVRDDLVDGACLPLSWCSGIAAATKEDGGGGEDGRKAGEMHRGGISSTLVDESVLLWRG